MHEIGTVQLANKWNWLISAFVASWILTGVPVAGQSADASTLERHRLDNGLNVLLYSTDVTDRIALVVLYAVGDDHDPPGKCGLAHLTEHMYVTAAAGDSRARTVDEFMRRYPNSWNAQTGPDYTVFATVFAAPELPHELREAAARMGDLRPTRDGLEREKLRLLHEVRNMFGGFPPLAAMNFARDRIRPSEIGHRKGGLPEHVETIPLEEIRAWWSRFYKPANATLVLAGAFDSRKTLELIARHFGSIPSGDKPPASRKPGPGQLGRVDRIPVTPALPNANGHVCIAFAAPEPGSKHYAACLVLVSRMWMRAAQAGGDPQVMFSLLDDPTTISVSAPLNPEQTEAQAVDGLRGFVEQATQAPLQPFEVVLTKNNLGVMLGVVDFPEMMFKQNLYGVAFSLGRREQLKLDAAMLRTRLDGLTDQDLREAARAIFAADRQAAVIIVTEGE